MLKLSLIAYLCIHAVQDDLDDVLQAASKLHAAEQTSMLVGKILEAQSHRVCARRHAHHLPRMDYGWQYKQFMKQMRMSHQDMKDEYKETEGNPAG